jgi:hypothetical protein
MFRLTPIAQVNSRIALRQKTTSEQSTGRNQDASIAMPRGKAGNDTIQISTDIYVSEVSHSFCNDKPADGQTKLDGNDKNFSVNRGAHYPGSSSSGAEEEEIGKESQHSSAWSPTTWDDRRHAEPGRMV